MSDAKSEKKDADAGKAEAPPWTRRSNRAIVLCVAAAALLTAADLASKHWAEGALSHARVGDPPEVCAVDDSGFVRYQRVPSSSISLVEDVFELEYAENCGAAFGLLRQAPTLVRRVVFGVAAIAATCVLLWLFIQGRGGPYFAVSVPLVISGAIGNFFDRFLYGYVVDFIHFHYEHPILWMDRFDYPTFNVADIAITIGVILLLIDGMRQEKPAATTSAGTSPPSTDADGEDEDDDDDDESATESKSESATQSEPKGESGGAGETAA